MPAEIITSNSIPGTGGWEKSLELIQCRGNNAIEDLKDKGNFVI
jgi:hypothetical protein